MNLKTSLLALSLVGALVGPAAAAPPATTAPAASAPEGAAKPSGPPQPWKEMTPQQRGKYMKEVVAPRMKVAFQEFDGHDFAKFSCATCHGEQAKARKFKMPNPDLPMLPATPAGFATLMEKKPKIMKFMGGTVKPQMAALLGLPEFDPKNPQAGGFGCGACHTTKKD
jgi:hypothetical protein